MYTSGANYWINAREWKKKSGVICLVRGGKCTFAPYTITPRALLSMYCTAASSSERGTENTLPLLGSWNLSHKRKKDSRGSARFTFAKLHFQHANTHTYRNTLLWIIYAFFFTLLLIFNLVYEFLNKKVFFILQCEVVVFFWNFLIRRLAFKETHLNNEQTR